MNKSYFVRTCIRNEEGQLMSPSRQAKGFIWPEEIGSVVTARDWKIEGRCGGGLHGLRPGDNNPGEWAEGPNAVWMICSYDPETAVEVFSGGLGGKIKVPSCTVEYVVNGSDGASTLVPLWLRNHGVTEPIYRGVVETHLNSNVGNFGFVRTGARCTVTTGNFGIAIAESYATAKAGDGGIAKVTVCSKATVGSSGFAISKYRGESLAGDGGFSVTGDYGTATAGCGGVAHATYNGIAIVGEGGTATSGREGKSIAGDYGTAITGLGGCAQAGYQGVIQIITSKNRIAIGYVGEDGIEADTLYKLDDRGKFVKSTDEERT